MSSTIYANALMLLFKIGLANHSTRTQRMGPARSLIQYAAHIYACFICFKLFPSMLIIMPSGATFNYSCKNSNFAILRYV